MLGAIQTLATGLKGYEDQVEKLRQASLEVETELNSTKGRILFNTIGRALTAWAKMEEFLVFVVALTLPTKPARAGLIMYSIINFNVWLSLIHDLMEDSEMCAPMLPRWNKISERIRRIKDLRDRLAHHSVKAADARLVPSQLDMRSKTRSMRPLDYNEVMEFTEAVLGICDDLEKFVMDMYEPLPASDKKSFAPPPDHLTESDSR
jgi:hypothetical protein